MLRAIVKFVLSTEAGVKGSRPCVCGIFKQGIIHAPRGRRKRTGRARIASNFSSSAKRRDHKPLIATPV